MKQYCFALIFLALAAAASAQTGATLKIQVYQAPVVGDITIVTPFRESTGVVITAAMCGLPLYGTQVPAVETNPQQAIISDPATPTTAICKFPSQAFFAGLPARGTATVGGYVSTVTVTDANGTSARSAAGNPFTLLPPPPPVLPAPTGHQVRPLP